MSSFPVTDPGQELWESVGRRLQAYLRCLPLPELRRLELAVEVVRDLQQSPPEEPARLAAVAMERLRQRLATEVRLSMAPATPPLQRGSMVPEEMDRRPWQSHLGRLLRRLGRALGRTCPEPQDALARFRTRIADRDYRNEPWTRVAHRRRLGLSLLVAGPSLAAGPILASVLPHGGASPLEAALVLLFTVLFAWISIGFWTAMLGFVTLLRRFDRFVLGHDLPPSALALKPSVRTALLFPVCNEEMARVTAGIGATLRSLMETGQADRFDLFMLSDTQDPDAIVLEEEAWHRLSRALGEPGNLFYRQRRVNLKRKSGNVADFCRRFGRRYKYMVVMDADSLMTGDTLVRMVATMEAHRGVGILQTAPAVVGRETLLARVQQFANRVYGPMFVAGLHSMQLGDAQFWGHNAILRVKPFMQHCALPRLPGKAPLGGDIMSHDFVESALMRRAGYGVWLAVGLEGSYEESPPTLLAELKRDRRWCTGNMQHLRLVFTRGLFPAHRMLFLNGVMSYFSAFLWFLLLLLSTAEAVLEAVVPPTYFPDARTLFPEWPVWDPIWVLLLLAATSVVLFLPKLASWLLIVLQGRRQLYGGALRLGLSIVGEVLISTLLAPIRMLFHSKFVFAILLGRQSGWGAQQRDDSGTPWGDALRFHGGGTVFALLWGGAMYLINRSFFWWISPILLPLVLAIPLSVWTSRAGGGRLARRLGLFLIPEEVAPPPELRDMQALEGQFAADVPPLGMRRECGLARLVLNPALLGLHQHVAGRKAVGRALDTQLQALVDKAIVQGPAGLRPGERKQLLQHPQALVLLHELAWTLPDETLRRHWGLPLH